MDNPTHYSKNMKLLAAIPVICCVVTIGYLQYQINTVSSRLESDTMQAIHSTVENNRLISSENSVKIDDLYKQIVNDTLHSFRADDMQIWIHNFKLENPDLHIPEFILISDQQGGKDDY